MPSKWDNIDGVSGDPCFLELPGGHKYIGQKNSLTGKPHGLGTWFPSDGTWLYEGQFKECSFHGKGRLIYSSKAYFEGAFDKGAMTGIGKVV